jgi:sarcosine oxidase
VSRSAAVVGAGIFGASLAYRLARDGWDVTLYERHEPGHERAASGGESRLIRFAHGADAWYTRSAWRARELWRELETETGRELLVECGVVWFGRSDDGWEAESERVLVEEGIPVVRLPASEGARFFPTFEPGDLEFLLWEPAAGVLRAAEATRATAEAAQRAGVRLVRETARPGRLDADAVVWACGAWLAEVFPGLGLRVTRQDLFFFAAGAAWEAPTVPAWVDYDRAVYGVADLDGIGVKVAPDVEGPAFDPESGERTPDPANEERARAYATERFPALADASLKHAKVCPYSLTPDTNFILARAPGLLPGNWILGGGSGHGFKHGPALAEYAARVISGEEQPDERFGLGPRNRGPSLRTAGTT